jgi:multidrug efflux pump
MAAAVIAALPAISNSLPEGMTLTMMYDSTEQIAASIDEVLLTIVQATLIVAFIILIFLGSFRSVLMPLVAIPLSLVGVLFMLFLMGYSINLLTLLAMVLAIGLVVDDAIIVVENVQRHIDEGLAPHAAASMAMKELFTAIVAMMLTLIAVFTPLFFTGGLTGALFREFAVTLAGAVFISGVVALTITPMMAARVLRAGGHGRFQKVIDGGFARLERWYGRPARVLARLSPGDAADRGGADRRDRLSLHAHLDRARARGGHRRALRHRQRAALRDQRLYRVLSRRRCASDRGPARAAPPTSRSSGSAARPTPASRSGPSTTGPSATGRRPRSSRTCRGASPVAGVEAFVFAPPSLPGAGGGLPISLVLQSTGDPSTVYEVAESPPRRLWRAAASSSCRTRSASTRPRWW